MQVSVIPFKPVWGSTVQIAATSTSANIAIPAAALTANSMRVRIISGTADVRVRSGHDNTVAAVAGDPLIAAGSIEAVGIAPTDAYVAAKTDSGTCTVEFTFGFGS